MANGIDDFEKRESVKVHVTGADATDSMLAHEDRSMRIMHEIAHQLRHVCKDLTRNFGVRRSRDEDVETRRREERGDELP
jgi:hypothetical protein